MSSQVWVKVGEVDDFDSNMGGCVRIGAKQIAVFNIDKLKWYAVDNLCPHQKRMVISRGIVGSVNEELKVACPLHKRNFSLESGQCLTDNRCGNIMTYQVKVEDGKISLFC